MLELGVGMPPDGSLAATALSAIFPGTAVSYSSREKGFSVPKYVENAWKNVHT